MCFDNKKCSLCTVYFPLSFSPHVPRVCRKLGLVRCGINLLKKISKQTWTWDLFVTTIIFKVRMNFHAPPYRCCFLKIYHLICWVRLIHFLKPLFHFLFVFFSSPLLCLHIALCYISLYILWNSKNTIGFMLGLQKNPSYCFSLRHILLIRGIVKNTKLIGKYLVISNNLMNYLKMVMKWSMFHCPRRIQLLQH